MRISGKTFRLPAIKEEKLGAFSLARGRRTTRAAPRTVTAIRHAHLRHAHPRCQYVPSSLMAYGYKGVKPVPGVPNMYLKDYQDNLWELDVRSIRPAAPETRSSHPR